MSLDLKRLYVHCDDAAYSLPDSSIVLRPTSRLEEQLTESKWCCDTNLILEALSSAPMDWRERYDRRSMNRYVYSEPRSSTQVILYVITTFQRA